MNKIFKFVSAIVIVAMSVTTSFAQIGSDQNNGAECGCPVPVSTRTVVDLATLGVAINSAQVEIQQNTTLTCDNIYTFNKKIFVGYGVTLTIQPGTVLKGIFTNDPIQASCLIVERGGKIIADGKPNCKIIMTGNNDPLDGTYSVTNVGDWGGLVLCGMATNNLLTAYNYGSGKKGSQWNGVGYIEGADNTVKTLWGAGDTITTASGQAVSIPTVFNDNDNSGILRYLSVRHAGALIGGNTAGNELNGISLYSIGRGTKIEYVETIAAADDNFEFFGGTVDVKHCSVLYGDDDYYDYDLGYSGRMQFNFGMAGDSLTGLHSTDNGYECDADDQSSAPWFDRSHPLIYNCTLISNGHIIPTADNTGPAAIQAKELTEGTFINNVFANFRSGLHVAQARSAPNTSFNGKGGDGYDNWTNDLTDPYLYSTTPPYYPSWYNNSVTTLYANPTQAAGGNNNLTNAVYHSLIVKNNTFVHCNLTGQTTPNGVSYWITKGVMTHNPGTGAWLYQDATPASAADTLQFYNDGNTHPSAVPGIDFKWSWNTAHTDFTDKYHAVPSTNIPSAANGSPAMFPPNDGFFDQVSYRGAFDATKASWLSTENGFTIPVASTLQSDNPTDLNNDGVTDINDFSIFIGKFGQLDK